MNSVINNSFKNLEIICVDDGSTDSTPQKLDKLAEKDGRVLVIHQENAGVSAARNVGLDVAKGEFIAFIDSDDWVHRDYFKVLLEAQKKYDSDITCCEATRVSNYEADTDEEIEFSSIRCVEVKFEDYLYNLTLKSCVHCKLIRAELTAPVRFTIGVKLTEDILFNIELICSNTDCRIAWAKVKIYRYFLRNDSATSLLPPEENFPSAKKLYKDALDANSSKIKAVYLQEMFKRSLSARYSVMFKDIDGSLRKDYNGLLNKAWKMYKKIDEAPKLKWWLFIKIPLSYRAFRLLTDRTMFAWEKNERAKRRKLKREIKE